MPWNEPGRGSGGGGGDRDPWKGGNGQQPPDLDEVFANVQQRLKKIMGGGDGGSNREGSSGRGGPSLGGIALLIGLVVVLWVVWNSVHIVDESERGVVLRFGEHVRTLNPGLNFTLPRPIDAVEKVNVTRVRSLESSSRMLTGDENLIDLAFAVQYRVFEPEKFLFNVQVPEESLGHAADSAMREIVGTNNMDFILEIGRGQIALDTQALLVEILSRYDSGLEITSFNLQEVRPPAQVRQAFDDVVRAREDQIRFANEAQAYANQIIPEARGQSARVLEEAQGYRESMIAQATGEADRFVAILTEYTRAPEVTRERLYLETLERIYGRSAKILMDVESSNNLFYLSLDGLTGGRSGAAPPPAPMMSLSEQQRAVGQTDPRARAGRGVR